MGELTANNFYQGNCVDLKLVPIIWFIFQFGFRKVWDSDPSGFGIVKCQSLGAVIEKSRAVIGDTRINERTSFVYNL